MGFEVETDDGARLIFGQNAYCPNGIQCGTIVFSFWRSNDFDFHCGWSQCSDLLLHTISNAWIHGGSTRQDSVGIQVLTNINIALHDGIVGGFMDSTRFHSQERRLEKSFWATESFISNGDYLSIGQFIRLLKR